MPTIYIDVSDKEMVDARAAKGGRSWREIIFDALDVQEEVSRRTGRPKGV